MSSNHASQARSEKQIFAELKALCACEGYPQKFSTGEKLQVINRIRFVRGGHAL